MSSVSLCKFSRILSLLTILCLPLIILSASIGAQGNTHETAYPIDTKTTSTGQIHDENQEDWWQVKVEEYGLLEMTLHIPDTTGRARVRLYRIDTPTTARETIYVEGGEDGTISYPVGPGLYLVRVNQNRDEFSYQLTTELKEALLPPSPLDNHSYEDAIMIEIDQEVTGTLGYYLYDVGFENDDWWQVKVEEYGLLEMTLHIPDTTGRARVRLYRIDTPTTSRESIYVEGGEDGTISYPVGPGLYLIRVTQSRDYFSYSLKAELERALLPPSPLDNHSYEDAVSMEVDQEVTGTLGYYLYDVGFENDDWWQIDVEEYGRLEATISIPDSKGRLRLRLYHMDDLSSNQGSIYVDAREEGSISFHASPGRYFLRVEQNREYFSYQLHVGLQPSLLYPEPENPKDREVPEKIEFSSPVTGILGYYLQGSEDWWEIHVPEEGDVVLNLYIPDKRGRLRLRLYVEDSTSHMESIYIDHREASSMITSLDRGEYHVRVERNRDFFSYLLTSSLIKKKEELQVVSLYPGDGRSQVSTTSVIGVTFNQVLDPDSVNGRSLQVYHGERRIEGDLQSSGTLLVFRPLEALDPDTTYHITLHEIRDEHGDTLSVDHLGSFSTAEVYREKEDPVEIPFHHREYMTALLRLEDLLQHFKESGIIHQEIVEELASIIEEFQGAVH